MQKSLFLKIAALAAVGALSQAAFAEDGTINFTGEITDAPCSVTASSQNLTVPLGKVSRNVFAAPAAAAAPGGAAPAYASVVGKKSVPAKFTIELNGCSAAANKATVTFAGTADSVAATKLAIASSGGMTAKASGVAIELADAAGTPIDLNAASGAYPLSQGNNSLKFQAAYYATTTSVTTGPANSVAQFTIAYN